MSGPRINMRQAIKDPLKPINTQARVSTEGLCVLEGGQTS